MRRSSIARLMIWIAFLAANLAAFRFLLSPSDSPRSGFLYPVLAGLIPLCDALVVAAAVLVGRRRMRPRSDRGDPGRFARDFVASGGPLLLLTLAAAIWAPGMLLGYFAAVWPPTSRALWSIGIDFRSVTPLLRYVVAPLYFGAAVSGPLLVASLALAALLGRFRVILTPRGQAGHNSAASG